MTKVYLGVGSNLGNREESIETAASMLKEERGIRFLQCASLYETEPVGGPPRQGKFLNTVFEIETAFEPIAFLAILHLIESRMGRVRRVRNEARVIDLDILYFGDQTITARDLSIPHPRICERMFVLAPMHEIAPDFIDPREKQTIRELYERLHEKDCLASTNSEDYKRA